jgi:hypothetical protein
MNIRILKTKKGSERFLFFMHVYLMYENSSPNLSQKQIHPHRSSFHDLLSVFR